MLKLFNIGRFLSPFRASTGGKHIFFKFYRLVEQFGTAHFLPAIPYSFGYPAVITNNVFFASFKFWSFVYPALFVVTLTNVSRLVLVFSGGRCITKIASIFECLVVFSFSLIYNFFRSAKKQNYFLCTELFFLTGYM